ncbi:MAG: ABC transporter ATP-binding protein, partial [Clostridia bacterium]|nr:ABC transporter ATP-binding protein [Clostridia bacterium]
DSMRKAPEGTLVIVSHQERILSTADEIVLLDAGHITAQGSAEDVLPRLVSGGMAQRVCDRKERAINERA